MRTGLAEARTVSNGIMDLVSAPLFRALILATGTLAVSVSASTAAEADIRLLRTDVKTAAAIRLAVDDPKIEAGTFTTRLDGMISAGRVETLASFQQPFEGSDSGSFKLTANEDSMLTESEDLIELGIKLDLNLRVDGGLVDATYVFSNMVKERKDRLATREGQQHGLAMEPASWHLLQSWGDADSEDLLLARFTGVPGNESSSTGAIRETAYRCELREIKDADLATFGKSTPATREKAVAWLRDRSPLLACATLRVPAMGRSTGGDQTSWFFERRGEWDTKKLGLELDILSNMGPDGRLADATIEGTWEPKGGKRTDTEATFAWSTGETFTTGETRIFPPTRGRTSGSSPMLVVTAVIDNIREGRSFERTGPLPTGDEAATLTYRVHPSLRRKLRGDSPKSRNSSLMDDLKRHGMTFPAKTSAQHLTNGHVLLRHTREGHLKFQEILDQLGCRLDPPAE